MEFSNNLLVLILAIIADAVAGDPRWLYSRIPHPIVVIGHQIELLDRFFNRTHYSSVTRKLLGVISILIIVSSAWLIGWLIAWSCNQVSFGVVLQALIVSIFLAVISIKVVRLVESKSLLI